MQGTSKLTIMNLSSRYLSPEDAVVIGDALKVAVFPVDVEWNAGEPFSHQPRPELEQPQR